MLQNSEFNLQSVQKNAYWYAKWCTLHTIASFFFFFLVEIWLGRYTIGCVQTNDNCILCFLHCFVKNVTTISSITCWTEFTQILNCGIVVFQSKCTAILGTIMSSTKWVKCVWVLQLKQHIKSCIWEDVYYSQENQSSGSQIQTWDIKRPTLLNMSIRSFVGQPESNIAGI